MYKILLAVLLIVISALLLTGCFEKEEENKEVVDNTPQTTPVEITEEPETSSPIFKEFDYDFENDRAFKQIEEATHLTSGDILSNGDIEALYGLSELEGVKVEVRKNDLFEVAIIKLKNTDQSAKALDKVSNRIKMLKLPEEKICVEQNQGILIVTLGENAQKLNQELTKQFSEI